MLCPCGRRLRSRHRSPSLAGDADGGRTPAVHYKSRTRRRRAAKGRRYPAGGVCPPCACVRGETGALEPNDHDRGSVVLLAESRMDGSPVGTMRIQTNRFNDLAIAQSVELPGWLKNRSMAEATRLAVALGRVGGWSRLRCSSLSFFTAGEAKIEWMVIAAKAATGPPIRSAYVRRSVSGTVHPHAPRQQHPASGPAFDVCNAEARWNEAGHPLFDFMCHTSHPDIDLSDADFTAWGESAPAVELPRRALANA